MNTTTVKGLVATTPRHLITADGSSITSFRLAEMNPKNDNTNWYTVICFKTLATNTSESVTKGSHIIVSGTLNIRDWDNGEMTGTSVEIEADSIGHDLNYTSNSLTILKPKVSHNCNCPKCTRK